MPRCVLVKKQSEAEGWGDDRKAQGSWRIEREDQTKGLSSHICNNSLFFTSMRTPSLNVTQDDNPKIQIEGREYPIEGIGNATVYVVPPGPAKKRKHPCRKVVLKDALFIPDFERAASQDRLEYVSVMDLDAIWSCSGFATHSLGKICETDGKQYLCDDLGKQVAELKNGYLVVCEQDHEHCSA
ncbi:hypothetical protein OHC33_007302 [Knufia fluminis]|uniref:Uncharacterized protein n=1 Tax=Knufia fluminis TaxID=191047 RepID=A0AAN8EHG1_9EURO|nr:hypothetical protein OHC33_007302 [Knufia fluminis]